MEKIINDIKNKFVIKKITNVSDSYFYNRNTLYVDLIKFLNELNEPLLSVLNTLCGVCYNIVNYENVNIQYDCNNNKLLNIILYITNRYQNYLLSIEIFVDNNNVSNFNNVSISNSIDTNKLNQSEDILNKPYNQDISNSKPSLDKTSLENSRKCPVFCNGYQDKSVDYNKWIINNTGIPEFYKSNFELHPETNVNNNSLFEGHRGLMATHSL